MLRLSQDVFFFILMIYVKVVFLFSAILFLCLEGTMVTSVPSGFHFNKCIIFCIELQFVGFEPFSYIKMSPVRIKNTALRGNKLGMVTGLCLWAFSCSIFFL